MKWATRKNMKCDRIASVWLIKKFIDPEAEIFYVDDSEIMELTLAGVLTFDASDAKYKHLDDPINGKYGNKCTFQIIMDEYGLSEIDPALKLFGDIVYAADIAHRLNIYEPKEGYGFWALTNGFSLLIEDDNEKEKIEFPVCEAMYKYCCNLVNTKIGG
jgi:hypothetical protein